MPGNSQGIVVSIQAKIEGWQNQIKAIQDALKNMKAGTGISKDLTKDLKQVETLVNNLGKNISQRLTSDSQITGFTDKLREVDEIFAHMGQRMTSVSFADMDPSYITNNFKDLSDAIDQANNALSNGMTNSFQNAIAESTNLQKAFDKLGIDPSKMGAEELKKLLETKSSNLTEEIAKTNKEIDNLRANAKAAKQTMEEMQKTKILQVTDTKAESKAIVGDTSNLGTRQMNTAALQELETKINDVILKGGATLEQKLKDKRDQIDKAIKDLVNAQSVEEARKKLQEIQDLFASVKAKGDFTKDIKIDKITDDQLTQWIPDPVAVQNKLTEIKSVLAEYKIDPTVLNKINMEELIKQGNFDKLEDEIDKALRKTQDVAEKDIQKIKQTFDKLKGLADTKQRQVMSDSATKYNIDQGLSQWDSILQKVQAENATLREEVEKLKAQLAKRATANVKALGKKTAASGAQGIQDSTNAAKAYEAQLGRVKSAEQALGKLQGVVQRWFSIYAVIRMVRNAINSMISTIKELDKTITNIAIVTDMGQDDLWAQMPKYTQMAREYASSIAGVYEVSQLYYQQGLQMADVMSLTEATLKMARISGLGYADATDYMTNAVRSFKMEMSEANTVVDVYSAVAASSATSVTELATAMSKTASSAEAVGSSFQNTTAMMAVMIEATRESPENIGSALKSIISRYGELKENKTGTDADGEAYSLNKVDTALQSIGISIHDVNGEFRDFDDVIMELAGKWDTVDKNTQRYIATVMAGNRQQSRFLALVSSGERLRELSDEAANSEDASQLQFLKSLDSIDSKVQQLQTSIQALYTNSGLEQTYKDILDFANRVVTSLDNISNSQGLVGVGAKIASVFTTLATLVTNLFTTIKLKFSVMQAQMAADAKLAVNERVIAEQTAAAETAATEQERVDAHARAEAAMTETTRLENEKRIADAMKASNWKRNTGMIAATAGLAFTTVAAGMDLNTQRQEKAWMTGIGSALSGAGTGLMMGGWVGAIVGTLTSLPGIIEAIGMSSESVSEKLTRLKTNVTEAQNKAIISKDELKNLTQYEEKLKELASKQYDSNEDRQAYLDLSNEIANKYPELISYIDEEGNKIVELGEAYTNLKQQKEEAYQQDAKDASIARVKAASDAHYRLEQAGVTTPERKKDFINEVGDALGAWTNSVLQVFGGSNTPGVFSEEGAAFDALAKHLATTGFSSATQYARRAGYHGRTSEEDVNKALFGVSKDITVNGETLSQALQGNVTLTEAEFESILAQQNDNARLGQLVDVLLSKENVGKATIDNIVSTLFNENAALNEDLWKYRTQVISSEKATQGAQKLIKAENKNLYSLTTSQDKYDIDKGMENAFLQYDFQQTWDNISKDLADDEISAAWELFAANAEDNIDSAITSYADLIASITDPQQSLLLDQMFKKASSYTTKEWSDQIIAASGNEDLQKFLQSYYDDQIKYASENFLKSYQNLATRYDIQLDSRYTEIAQNIGGEYLSSIISQYEDIFKNKNLSSTQQTELVKNLENAYLSTSQIADIDQRNAAVSLLTKADLSTQTGIFDAIDSIDKLNLGAAGEAIKESLRQLATSVSTNLVTEFSNLADAATKGLDDFSKAVKHAINGMDLKDAVEMANKMGKSLSTDFLFKNGKYYYNNIQDIQDAYMPQNKELLANLQSQMEAAKAGVKSLGAKLGENQTFDLDQIDNAAYLEQWSSELEALGLTQEKVLNRQTEMYSLEREQFNTELIHDREYLEQWSDELEARGLTVDEILNPTPVETKYWSIADNEWATILQPLNYAEKLKDMSRPVSYFVHGNKEIEDQLAELSRNSETLNLDQLMAQYNNDVDAVVDAVSGQLKNIKGLDKGNLAAYLKLFKERTGEDLELGFDAWFEKYLNQLYEDNQAAIEAYTKDQTARQFLSAGDIQGFLNTTLGKVGKTEEEYLAELRESAGGIEQQGMREAAHEMAEETYDESERAAIENAIASGETSNLPEDLQKYAKLIHDTFNSVEKNVADAMFSATKGGETKIFADQKNLKTIKDYAKQGLIKGYNAENADTMTADQYYEFDEEAIKVLYEDDEKFYAWLDEQTSFTKEQRKAYISARFNFKYPKIKAYNSTVSLLEKDTLTASDIQSYMTDINAEEQDVEKFLADHGAKLNAFGEVIIESKEQWNALLEASLGEAPGDDASAAEKEAYEKAKAKLESARRSHDASAEIKLNKAAEDVINNYNSFTEAQYDALQQAMSTEDWTALSTYITGDTVNGYSINLADLKKAIDDGTLKISDATKEKILSLIDSAFDSAISYIGTINNLMINGTTKESDMSEFTEKMNQLRKEGYLSGGQDPFTNENFFEWNEVTKSFEMRESAYQRYLQGEKARLAELNYSTEQIDALIVKQAAEGVHIDDFLKATNTSEGSQARQKLFNEIKTWRLSHNNKYSDEWVNYYIKQLEAGGDVAVEVLKQIAADQDVELSAEQISNVYRAKVNKIVEAADQATEAVIGNRLETSSKLFTIMHSLGMADSNGVVTSTRNMVEVYRKLYEQMKATSEKTVVDLNKLYAKQLTASESEEMNAISVLEDAMSMTYESLGEFLGKYDESLETWLDENQDLYELMGGGKLRITDFSALADKMGWEFGSEEYVSAFKTYNDALIDLDRKANKTIAEELKSITSASAGDQVNLTQTWAVLTKNLDEGAKEKLKVVLQKAGASLENGILRLAENANIEEIVKAITEQETITKSLLPEELAELRDAVEGLISDITSLISSGIEGTLSNSDALKLSKWASNNGVSLDLSKDLKKTEKGLKLSEKAAFKLYLVMKNIDKIQAKSMLPIISKMSKNYSSLANACARYNKLIKANTSSLLEEKAVLEDLIKLQLTDPSSFSFMSGNEMPVTWQYVNNYLENLQSTYNTIDQAIKKQSIKPQDLSNLLTMAEAVSPNIRVNGMDIDQLRHAAAGAFTLKNGEVVIDLSKKGLNLDIKALQSFYSQLQSGLDLLGKQAEAYYDLGDKFQKINDAMHRIEPIDFSKLFGDTPYGTKYVNLSKLQGYFDELNKSMPELAESLKNVIINGKSLGDAISSGRWIEFEKLGFTQESFTTFFEGIYDIDWSDATTAALDVSNLLKKADLGYIDIPLSMDNFIHITPTGNIFKIDLNDKSFKNKVIKDFNNEIKNNKILRDLLQAKSGDVNAKNVTSALLGLSDAYDNPDMELTLDQKIAIRRVLSFAEGKFDPNNFEVDRKNNKVRYVYNGKVYEADWDPQKQNSIQAAKDTLSKAFSTMDVLGVEGFDGVEATNNYTTFTAKKSLGLGMTMEVTISSPEDGDSSAEYIIHYKGFTASGGSYRECMEDAIYKGLVADPSMEGTTIDVKGIFGTKIGTAMVKIDSSTGLMYTYQVTDTGEEYIIDNHHFTDIGVFKQYLNTRSKYDGIMSDKKDEETENIIRTIDLGGKLQVKFNLSTGETVYTVNDQPVETEAEFKAWQEAQEQTGFKFLDNSEGKPAAEFFTDSSFHVTMNYTGDGVLTYTVDAGDLGKYTATGINGLQTILNILDDTIQNSALDEGTKAPTLTIEKNGDIVISMKYSAKTKKVLIGNEEFDLDDTEGMVNKLMDVDKTLDAEQATKIVTEFVAPITTKVDSSEVDNLNKELKTPTVKPVLLNYKDALAMMNGLIRKPITKEVKFNYIFGFGFPQAKGNVPGIAAAGGRSTLMGELGPELVVSNGHYFIVGQGGAEMVTLADDAIVFNHIQTQQLLRNGKTGRGKPYINDRTSAGMATGNINGGPARVDGIWGTIVDFGQKVIGTVSDFLGLSTKPEPGDNPPGGGGSSDSTKEAEKAAEKAEDNFKSKLSSLLSDVLDKGFAGIDWSEYEKDLAEIIDELKADAQGSYLDFIHKYAKTAGQSLSEINDLLFQAYQKDLGTSSEEYTKAAKELTYYANGEVSASDSDWQALFNEHEDIDLYELLKSGKLYYDQTLETYILNDLETLQELGLDTASKFAVNVNDSLRETLNTISDYIKNGIEGSLSDSDLSSFTSLISRMIPNFDMSSINVNSSTLGNQFTKEALDALVDALEESYPEIASEVKDSINQLIEDMVDIIGKGLGDGMTNAESTKLINYIKSLGVDLDLTFTNTLTGLKLSTESAIELYSTLQDIDAVQAQLVFKKLNESLKESNDHYKTTTKILARIRELQDAINDAEHYSDEKIKQYKQELALAKEILAVRATSQDDSFDIANREIPGGLKNALTYAESISSIAREFRSAFEDPDNDIIDFQHFYNMAYEINDAAAFLGKSIDFLGYTLDGKIDNLDKLITQAANSLGASADGSNFGVSLSKLGTDLKNGMNGFVGGADEAMHAMAQAQIEILDGLIAMFEVIVAMEEFEGADINKNGLLDLDEIFDLTGLAKDAIDTAKVFKKQFKEAATAILETLNSNDAYQDIADSIKLNGYTFRQILEDATDGIRDIVEISAEEYQQMVSVLYEAFSNGDYDLNDIYNSLKENFINNDSNWDGNLEINDLVFNVKYKAELTKTAEGYETPGGTVYPDAKTAVQGLAIESVGGTNITFDPVTMTSTGSITLGKSAISLNVATDNSGEVTYYSSSGAYYTLDDAIRGEWEAARAGGSTTLDLEEWKIDQKIKVVPVVEADLKETDLDLDQKQINAAIGKSYDEIRAEWQAAVANGTELEFEAKYGVSFTNSTTEEDWLRFKELAGIETKNIELNASINIVNSSNEVSQLLTFDSSDKSVTVNVAANTDNATQAVEALKNNVDSTTGTVSVDANVDSAVSKLQKVIDAINDIDTDININVNVTQTGEVPSTSDSSSEAASAKGTVSGEAFAGGTRTLMGELGPELYVSGGRYHLAGQNGAEFVNLPDDAIVFNHLQTQRLLSTGSAGRGKPVTNEANAVAMARGTGPAAATARETLATLKQIRAMWQSLANMSVSELAGSTKATDSGNKENIATWIQQIEKWFTLLQKIATLEKEINREEKLRSALQSKTVAMGDKYAQSLVRTLKASKEQLALEQELANSYLQEYNKKRTEINGDSPFNYFFTFDEKGQIIYDESHYQDLVNLLNTQYETNELAESQPQRQVALAKQYGLSRYMEYDSSGKKITREENESDSEFAVRQLDALKYSMDTIKEEIQGDYDAWFEHTNTALDLESSINSTVQEIRNNQKDLEDKVVAAIEAREQAVIDKMTDEREKLSKASQSYIQGLQDALSKERKMYENNQNDKELASLNRKLSILQRSGGSQSEITALQKEIQEKNKDMYFTAQEDQIAAIQDASDLQLEKMQTQIDLMTETLEYSKEHGLLWAEVNEVLKGTSEQIATFITSNMSEWQSKSTLAQEEELKEILFIAQEFTELKEYNSDQISGAANTVSEKIDEVLEATNITIEKKNTAPIITTPTTTITTNNKQSNSKIPPYLDGYYRDDAFYWDEYGREWIYNEGAQKTKQTPYSKSSSYGSSYEKNLQALQTQVNNQKNYIKQLQQKGASEQELQQARSKLSSLTTNLALHKFKHGGMVTETGLVQVHGTEARPEAFMNANEVQMWKQDILGGGAHSLLGEMLELRSLYNSMSNISDTVTQNTDSIVIEHAEVNMNIDQLADDYDARRAGTTALDEMLKIARKSGANSIRR